MSDKCFAGVNAILMTNHKKNYWANKVQYCSYYLKNEQVFLTILTVYKVCRMFVNQFPVLFVTFKLDYNQVF